MLLPMLLIWAQLQMQERLKVLLKTAWLLLAWEQRKLHHCLRYLRFDWVLSLYCRAERPACAEVPLKNRFAHRVRAINQDGW